ncbi:hypothetical protein MHUMG1_02481 [Metarhizium humberi]|uniref:JmjC domain-containing protein n=1 Tax=Metarhizium humberi TaxID=2596975 RepID=A0A9P8MGA9_9HYPO|nr:hypothetical protein MHUMG1_02481 [Metarhizium humberi]
MPTSLHPQAKFDPIPPDLDLYGLVDRTPNFKWVQRVSRSQVLGLGQQGFEKLIQIHVIAGGKPLVIDGWDALLPEELFNVNWLEKTYDKKVHLTAEENVRDVTAGTDIPMTTGHYLRSMKQLTNQWTPQNFRDERRQRLYLKDIDCPVEWRYELQTILHPNLFYLNDNVTKSGSSNPTRRPGGDGQHGENSIAPAGDLMSSLPEEMRAENLMCYVGHEGTYTPAHREMCASVGHNIMVETSGDSPGERPGSSIWFMTESKDRDVVREYFLSMLGHDIEIEKHFAQINAWKKAPFDVYLVDQRAGDFIIIPPLAAHQVWNRGTRTMKVAWNRTTPETLRLALREALPKARLLLKEMERQEDITQNSFMGIGRDIVRNSPRARQLAGDFRSLFSLFTEILIDEAFAYNEKQVERLPFDSCVTCSYCRCNIFNRFLTCKNCTRVLVNGDEDAYDICMECYAMGRSCACLSGLQWCEQWSWSELSGKYELWREMVIVNDGFVDLHSSPPPFETARQKSAKKSVAQICQEALIRRPWKDITKQDVGKAASDSEQGDVEDEPKKKTKRKQKKGEVRRCHARSELAEVESERALLGDGDNSQRATNTDPEGRDPERQSAHEYPTLALESENSSRLRSDSAGPPVAQNGISPYPDPSVASNYGIGMGYYEQDDTPDKILFDPYKAPSPSAIHLADLEVPDSVKKSIRAAKRKAKRENEDPDFIVGRSSHKRSRHTNGIDILDNLDPALFDVEPSTASSTLRQRRLPSTNTIRHPAENQDGNLETLSTEPLTEPMPTEPTLRHARPLASYVEVDDVDMDEVEEGEMVGEGSGQEAVLDDKAAKAIEEARLSEVQNSGLQQETSVTSKHLESTQGRKSRVRPLQVSLRSVDSVSMTDPISPRPAIRRRGRPRKSTVVSLKQSDTAADGTAGALRDQGESLGEAPDTSNVRSSNYQQLKSNSSIGASLQQHEEPSVRSVATVGISQERNLKDVGRELRSNPRGRESRPEAKNPASEVRNLKSASQPFMSMAERLALKGRKFKIGRRRAAASPLLKDKDGGPHVSEASESTIRESRQVLSAVAGRTEGSYRHQSQSRRGPRTSSAAAGPLTNLSDDEQESVSKSSDISTTQKTVVRLTDMVSSEDEHGSTIDMAVSSSDDSGDSDIPASGMNSRERASTELGYTQSRGGRRGGGRGRGRRRGRPRGSGRGTFS